MAAHKDSLTRFRKIKNIDEIKVRTSQVLSSWLDRVWIKRPDFSNKEFQLPAGFPPTLAKVYIASHENSLKHLEGVAESILGGKVNIFGKRVHIPGSLPWHRDFLHGYDSPLVFWKKIPFLEGTKIGDSKVIWELNRMQILIPVAKAYFLTGDSIYYRWIKNTLLDWIKSNPYPKGINWASSIELAFRVVTIDWVVRFCRSALNGDTKFCLTLFEMLAIHGWHIARYLSTYFSPNTHLTAEALGLYLLGSRYQFLPGAQRWRKIGRNILLDCLDCHVLPDGGYFERSLWYHRYTLEIYLLFSILAQESGHPLPPLIGEKLADLSDFLVQSVRDDGTFPLIGDDDGGRFLAFDNDDPGDIRGLLALVGTYLGRENLKYLAQDHTEAIWWVLGESGINKYQELGSKPPRDVGKPYQNTGYAFFRNSWSEPSTVISLDAGSHGAGNCGHAHGDALSITLSIGRFHIIVDPGTYTYTLDLRKRNLLRSPEAHSTLLVKGLATSIPDQSPFHWKRYSNSFTLEDTYTGNDLDLIGGRSNAYRELGADLVHRRKLLFIKPKNLLLIWDFLQGTGTYEIILQYVLAGYSWQIRDKCVCAMIEKDLCVTIEAFSKAALSTLLEPFEISPGYMRMSEGNRLSFRCLSTTPQIFTTIVAWGKGLRNLKVTQHTSNSMCIQEGNENIWCAVAAEDAIGKSHPFNSDASAACVITTKESVNKAWAIGVSALDFFSNTLIRSDHSMDFWEV